VDPFIYFLTQVSKSDISMSVAILGLWPALGLLAIKTLQAPWMIAPLGRSLSWCRSIGIGIAAMPKTGILKLLFGPFVYLLIYAIASLMALADGILGKSDPETQKLANTLIAALRKAGAKDTLLYLEHKAMEPAKAGTVKMIQTAMNNGASPIDAAAQAVLAAEKTELRQ